MACYHPLNAVQWFENGQRKVKVVDGCYFQNNTVPVENQLKVPCGQCVGCRLERSRQWANRCMCELQYHDSAQFITLTYDDEHLPFAVDENGETRLHPTLVPRDFTLWMKELRQVVYPKKIRFFACGEYGDHTARPHYHAIVFGLDLPDRKARPGQTVHGHKLYNSSLLEKTWDKGFIVTADVSWQTCAYVARYVMKKQTGDKSSIYKELGIEPEFVRMSRRPGIGRQYFEDHGEIYDYDKIFMSTPDGSRSFTPPRYFDRLMQEVDPERLQVIKDHRRAIAEMRDETIMSKTSLDHYDYDRQAEEAAERNKKILRRNFE